MRWFGLSFAPFSKNNERLERQDRHGPPPEFSLTLPFSSFVHHLSGPDTSVFTRNHSQDHGLYTYTDTNTYACMYIYIDTSYHEPSRTQPKVEGKGVCVCFVCDLM